MTKQEAVLKMFPNKDRKFLGEVWDDITFANSPTFNIMELDDKLIAEYGEYEGSMKDFVTNKFGLEVADLVIESSLRYEILDGVYGGTIPREIKT